MDYSKFKTASWRNGSAFDSRSKGYPFKSGRGQIFLPLGCIIVGIVDRFLVLGSRRSEKCMPSI
ncbi:hypothetical protein F4815DRAFT_462480 [Daldinia loculata]|nr:hypothetical protein F4815DRAFT_462480 [Daldinia loculata]